MRFARKGQVSVEWIVLLAVLFVLLLIVPGLLNIFPQSVDTKMSSSHAYWSGPANPFKITDWKLEYANNSDQTGVSANLTLTFLNPTRTPLILRQLSAGSGRADKPASFDNVYYASGIYAGPANSLSLYLNPGESLTLILQDWQRGVNTWLPSTYYEIPLNITYDSDIASSLQKGAVPLAGQSVYVGGVDRSSGCAPGMVACNEACCGGVCDNDTCVLPGQTICGNTVCPAGQFCVNGLCQPTCTSPNFMCASNCCNSSSLCQSGSCISNASCSSPNFTCGNNCCNSSQLCQGGSCINNNSCTSPRFVCGNSCCASTARCDNSTNPNTCSSTCPANETLCPNAANCCAAGLLCYQNSSLYSCLDSCPAGTTECGNHCVNSSICPTCVSGTCCTSNVTCMDNLTNITSCCASGEVCINGTGTCCGGDVCNISVNPGSTDYICCGSESACLNVMNTSANACCSTNSVTYNYNNGQVSKNYNLDQFCGDQCCPQVDGNGDPYNESQVCVGAGCCTASQVCLTGTYGANLNWECCTSPASCGLQGNGSSLCCPAARQCSGQGNGSSASCCDPGDSCVNVSGFGNFCCQAGNSVCFDTISNTSTCCATGETCHQNANGDNASDHGVCCTASHWSEPDRTCCSVEQPCIGYVNPPYNTVCNQWNSSANCTTCLTPNSVACGNTCCPDANACANSTAPPPFNICCDITTASGSPPVYSNYLCPQGNQTNVCCGSDQTIFSGTTCVNCCNAVNPRCGPLASPPNSFVCCPSGQCTDTGSNDRCCTAPDYPCTAGATPQCCPPNTYCTTNTVPGTANSNCCSPSNACPVGANFLCCSNPGACIPQSGCCEPPRQKCGSVCCALGKICQEGACFP